MAAVKNQTAPVASVIGQNQRRLLLEVLRANLRAKNGVAVGIPCEQQPLANQTITHHPAAPIRADLCGVASALTGGTGFRPSLAQKLVRNVKGSGGEIHTATVAGEGASWKLHTSVDARTGALERDGIHAFPACITEAGEPEQVSVGSNSVPPASQDMQVERTAEAGAGQQGLSIALFAKLAEGLPNDQGGLHFLTWADGSCYCGHVSGGSLDGIGVYRYTDNSIYCGQWVRDHLQGNGAFITANGFLYRGRFEADKQHGAGVFVVPTGRTFFGSFRHGQLHGLSCCVSGSGGSKPLLGEWHDGEFQRAFPLHARVADFYLRAAESVDLLESVWNPLPIPMPDASTIGTTKDEMTAQGLCQTVPQLCSAAVLEALRMELPKSLLQVAAASAMGKEMTLSSQAERHASARLTCNGRPIVRKRKANLLRPQGRDGREPIAASKSRCSGQESGVPSGGPPVPQRATTTKAQLLRWESEARKLPRIPHLNYNRVLGRWYARVRDPASGRRIWKGYTCAVHGFYQARDMAIDRLRQFSQLVSPLASGEPDSTTAAEDLQTPLTSDVLVMQSQNDHAGAESCGGASEAATPLAICNATGIPVSQQAETSTEEPPLVNAASDDVCCSLNRLASDLGAHSGTAVPCVVSGCEKAAVEDNDDEGTVDELRTEKEENVLNGSTSTEFASQATHLDSAPVAREDQTKQQLSAGTSSTLLFGYPSGDVCCRSDTVLGQEGQSIACSRLTTADCTESALSRCTPLPI